jgi:hypothetical protein
MLNVVDNPLVLVAEIEKGASPYVLYVGGSKVMVWAYLTVNDLVALALK